MMFNSNTSLNSSSYSSAVVGDEYAAWRRAKEMMGWRLRRGWTWTSAWLHLRNRRASKYFVANTLNRSLKIPFRHVLKHVWRDWDVSYFTVCHIRAPEVSGFYMALVWFAYCNAIGSMPGVMSQILPQVHEKQNPRCVCACVCVCVKNSFGKYNVMPLTCNRWESVCWHEVEAF